MPNSPPATPSPAFIAWTPALFVILWSTGFIGMRYGTPFAEPFTFMMWRMAIVVSILGVIVLATRAPWPASLAEAGHIAVAGLLVHATYLCGVLYAINLKLPLGFVALLTGLQPILTAVFANLFLHEKLNLRQWIGMALGLGGVVLVVMSKFTLGHVNAPALVSAGIALLGITFGTLYQKRHCSHMDLRTGGVIQFSATGLVMLLLAMAVETRQVQWTGQFIFALFWLAVVLSIGAISLLYLMIRRGAASRVASLFFLTPSVTAIMAFGLFDESLTVSAVAGLLVTAVGVALVMRSP
ncbi:MAG: DMT family transporter, partial [Betaproteobacteria bacterium]